MPNQAPWTQQDRDERGRFGALAPPVGAGTAAKTRARAISYGALGHLPVAQRTQYEAHLRMGGLDHVTGSLLAWHAAAHLDRSTFRDKFLGGVGSDALVDLLRKAAAGASAATEAGVAAATTELAAAHQLMGAGAWPRFVAASHGRAIAAVAPAEPVTETADPVTV